MDFLIKLFSDILSDVITGQVESTSDRLTHKVWWRFPIYVIIVGSAAWVAVASALLWQSESHPGVVGLIDFVGHGGPAWLLNIPLVAVLAVIAGSLPVAGRYGLALILQAALFALTLAGLATFQADGHSAVNLPAITSFIVTLPATLLALITALADVPPITSPLAYLTMNYMGRVGHLRRLLASAHRLGWATRGPEGKARALTIGGYYGDYAGGYSGARRSVRVVSGMSGMGEATTDQGYWYKATVTSPSALPSFEITRKKLPPHIAARAVTGKLSGGTRPLQFYVIPPYGRPIPDAWKERFARQVTAGKDFVRSARDGAQLTPGGILYSSFRMMRLPAKSGDIEPLVGWLAGIASLLEELAPPTEQTTPYTIQDYTPRQPYGQISDVDPTSRPW